MAKKEINYYVVIVDGTPLCQLISDRTKKERAEIARYKQLAGIRIREAQQEDYDRAVKGGYYVADQKPKRS